MKLLKVACVAALLVCGIWGYATWSSWRDDRADAEVRIALQGQLRLVRSAMITCLDQAGDQYLSIHGVRPSSVDALAGDSAFSNMMLGCLTYDHLEPFECDTVHCAAYSRDGDEFVATWEEAFAALPYGT